MPYPEGQRVEGVRCHDIRQILKNLSTLANAVRTANTSANITQRPISVTAATSTKTYDGTISSTGSPTITTGSLATGDATTSFTQVFDSRNAGSRTLTPSGTVNDGNSGNNYAYTFLTAAATINPLAITVTATADSRIYDGTTSSNKTPTISPTLISPDTSGFTEAFNSKNAGARSLVPSGSANDGNSGHNYAVTFVSTPGSISPHALTITAVTNTKIYDGSMSAAAVPSVSSLQVGDTTSGLVETYDNANAGTGKTLTVTAYVVNDANSGGNYTVTTVTNTTGSITAAHTSAMLVSSANPSVFPLAITFTATIANTDTSPVPPGTATFMDGSTTLAANVPLASGAASFTTSGAAATALSAASHSITVTYTPASANFQSSGAGPLAQSVTNTTPTVTITAPTTGTVAAVGASTTFTATFTDTPGDTHTAKWLFSYVDPTTGNTVTLGPVTGTVTESPSGGGTVALNYAFSNDGVYNIELDVTDFSGAKGTATQFNGMPEFAVIYNPNAGFVTGGGWVNSQAGSMPVSSFCNNCTGLTGKASFGFNAQYKKGQSTPDGQTQFQFQVGNLDFHSTSYQWLVVSGPMAQYKGTGTINGSGSYGFMLTARDGNLPGGGGQDGFRMQITDSSGATVYDNMLNAPSSMTTANVQVLSGGSIVIHTN